MSIRTILAFEGLIKAGTFKLVDQFKLVEGGVLEIGGSGYGIRRSASPRSSCSS